MTRAVLLLLVAVAYAPALVGPFQFDDYNVIVNNPVVHSWGAWWSDIPVGLRPLLKASYTLNWTSGLGAGGFHAFNILVHALNTLLAFELARRIAPQAAPLAAALFALHPIAAESVAYISGRSSSLMASFYLASILIYLVGKETARWHLVYVASPLLFLCALATKEVALTLPFALVLYEKRLLRQQAAHWALLAGFGALLFIHSRYSGMLGFALGIRGTGDNLLTQIDGVTYLLSRLVWLGGMNIDPDLAVRSAWSLDLVVKAAFLAALAGTGFACMPRLPVVGFGLLWAALHLLPTNSLMPRLDVANERALYLASFGIFLALAALLPRRRMAFVILIGTLGTATFVRALDYRSEIALWEDTAAKSPAKARVWNNLGYAYYLAGRHGEARGAYVIALRLDPSFELAANNLRLLP